MAHVLSRPDSIRQRAQHAATISGALAVALIVAAVSGLANEVESFKEATKWLVYVATVAFATSTVWWVYVVVFPHSARFDVVLTGIGDERDEVIRTVCTATALDWDDAKALVNKVAIDKTPTLVKKGLRRNEADALKAKLTDAGARLAQDDYQSLVEQYETYADDVRQNMRWAATATAFALLMASAAVVVEMSERLSSDRKPVTLVVTREALADVEILCPAEAPSLSGEALRSELAKDKVRVVNVVQRCGAITLPRKSIRAVKDLPSGRAGSDRPGLATWTLHDDKLDDDELESVERRCRRSRIDETAQVTADLSEDAPLATDTVEAKDITLRCTGVVRLPRKWIIPAR